MNSKDPSLQNIVCSEESLDTSTTAESNSQFGDGSCGEPLIAQHLVIDFTPTDEDNEYNQKKCCAFWDFIKSFPELKSLMVLPEPILYNSSTSMPSSSTASESSAAVVRSTEPDEIVGRTAVSMLGLAEEKGLIDRIFEAKLPQSTCSVGLQEYAVGDPRPKKISITKTKSVCSCGAKCTVCQTRQSSQPTSTSSTKAKELCNAVQSFDEKHPRSFIPPGHPPGLSHSIMQRKITKTNY